MSDEQAQAPAAQPLALEEVRAIREKAEAFLAKHERIQKVATPHRTDPCSCKDCALWRDVVRLCASHEALRADYDRLFEEHGGVMAQLFAKTILHDRLRAENEALRGEEHSAVQRGNRLAQEAQSLRAALTELVALKAIKERIKKLDFKWDSQYFGVFPDAEKVELKALKEDYERRKPAAWDAARQALAGGGGEG